MAEVTLVTLRIHMEPDDATEVVRLIQEMPSDQMVQLVFQRAQLMGIEQSSVTPGVARVVERRGSAD